MLAADPGASPPHLAPDPGGGRAGRHVEVNPFSPVVSNQEEDIEDAVAHGLHDEEVGGPDATQLIGQEGTPVLGSAGLYEIAVNQGSAAAVLGAFGDAGATIPEPDDFGLDQRYIAAYEQITGLAFAPDTEPPLPRIHRNLGVRVAR